MTTPDAADLRVIARHAFERRWLTASLILIATLAWIELWVDAARMPAMPPPLNLHTFAMSFAMWTVMSIGMMLPSAAPTISLYATIARQRTPSTSLRKAWTFTAGYLAVWSMFSLVMAMLQTLLQQVALLTPTLASSHAGLTAAVLIGAGVYQLSPMKDHGLRRCRYPLPFFMMHWRDGTPGAFRMGAAHGGHCVTCCWVLMLVMLVAGVMNLVWAALIAALIFVEKLLPMHRLTTRVAGVSLIAIGALVLVRG